MDCWAHPGVSGSAGLGQGLRMCISNKLPWEADALRLLARDSTLRMTGNMNTYVPYTTC